MQFAIGDSDAANFGLEQGAEHGSGLFHRERMGRSGSIGEHIGDLPWARHMPPNRRRDSTGLTWHFARTLQGYRF